MYGWTGKVLRVDLTNRKVTKEDDAHYADKFIGGVGFGAKIYWDEVSPEITAFDPENRLIMMPGPAGGTIAPSSGRFEAVTKIPASYPFEQYCRSGCGGSWGPEVKFAGYDGLIIQGKADEPVYLWIHDDEVEIKDASHLWGHGTFITNDIIKRELGDRGNAIKIAAIGQAGENLATTATINVGRNALGQGGFGAVMGSKNLKAIAVKGTGTVPVAQPDALMDFWMGVRDHLTFAAGFAPRPADKAAPDGLGPYGYKRMTCSATCPGACVDTSSRVPAPAGGTNEAYQRCSTNAQGFPIGPYTRSSIRGVGNDWGINLYEVGLGIVPWVQFCCNADLIHDVGGVVPPKIPLDSPTHPSNDPVDYIPGTWSYESVFAIMKAIAFKEGDLGEALVKGAFRARDEWGFGTEFLQICYHKDGFNDHCGSRWSHAHHYPFWIWAALSRATYHRDTADHLSHGICHLEDYATEYGGWLSWEQMNEAAQHLWGEPAFTHDYKNKERTEQWFQNDCAFLCSLVLCDWLYWRTRLGPEGVAVVRTPQGKVHDAADMPYLVYNYVTGKSIDKAEQLKIGERIFNLERAIYMREGYQGRQGGWFTKADEAVIPYFVKWGDVHDQIHMDAVEFRALMDRYYTLVGWDVATGMPKRETYEGLGLKYVADELATIGKLP